MDLINLLEIRMKEKRAVEGNFTIENYNTVLKCDDIPYEKLLAILFELDSIEIQDKIIKERVRRVFSNKELIKRYFSEEEFLDKLYALAKDSAKKEFIFTLFNVMYIGKEKDEIEVKIVLDHIVEGNDRDYTAIAKTLFESLETKKDNILAIPEVIDRIQELNLFEYPTRIKKCICNILKKVYDPNETDEILEFLAERKRYMIPLAEIIYTSVVTTGAYGSMRLPYIKKYFPIIEKDLEENNMYQEEKKAIHHAIEAFSDSELEKAVDDLMKKNSILYTLRWRDVKKVLDPIENSKHIEACCKLYALSPEKKENALQMIETNTFNLDENKLNALASVATSKVLKSSKMPEYLYMTFLQVCGICLFLGEEEKFEYLSQLFSGSKYKNHQKELVRSMKYILNETGNKKPNDNRDDLSFAVNSVAMYYNDEEFEKATKLLKENENSYWVFQLLLTEEVYRSEDKEQYFKMCKSENIESLYEMECNRIKEEKLLNEALLGVSDDVITKIKTIDTNTIFPNKKGKVKTKSTNKNN